MYPTCYLKLSDAEAAYIAGFFDGEGMVTIHRDRAKGARGPRVNPNYVMSVRIAQGSLPVLEWIKSKVGGSITRRFRESHHTRQHWTLALKSHPAQNFLEVVLPYLIVKREEAVHAIAFQLRQSSEKNRYEAGRVGPVPRTPDEIAYKEHYFRLLQQLKKQPASYSF